VLLVGDTPPAQAMTVDVEDWYHSNFRSAPALDPDALPSRVEQGVERLLELFERTRATATFFVLGEVARRHKQLVRRIAAAGHEIGCHGLHHQLIYEQTPDAFEGELRVARELLRDQAQQPVQGFRAPSWSITERSLWALDRLATVGFEYDSSVFPAQNYLYGITGAPTGPYEIPTGSGRPLLEIPPSTRKLGPFRIGVGGGLYLRLLPLWVHRQALRSYRERARPFVGYIHPREFDPGAWPLRLPLSWAEQLLHRFRLASVPGRIEGLMQGHRWESLGSIARRAREGERSSGGCGLSGGLLEAAGVVHEDR